VIIDFPQAVDARTNPAAPELLLRDLQHVAGWFEQRGAATDPDALFAELVTNLF
jgi:serine/threonine-protein kinase RIO1